MNTNTQPLLSPSSGRLARISEIVSSLGGVVSRNALERSGMVVVDENQDSLPAKIRQSLQSLGVTFVKLGQTLSTRRDLLDPAWVDELSKLSSDVAPLSWEVVQHEVERELGGPLLDTFEFFDPQPLGAASIGQVHRATLWDGREVAVKLQRPDAREQVEQDLQLLEEVARTLAAVTSIENVLPLQDVVRSFGTTLKLELDYRVEARNLRRVRRILAGNGHIEVPLPIDDHCTQRLLVMELVQGVPLSRAENEPRPALAKALCDAYLDQVVKHGFFHADPHPGNLLISGDQLALIDLGMVEILDDQERTAVSQLVLGLARGSTNLTTEAIMELSEPTDNASPVGLKRAVAVLVREAVALRGIEPTFGGTTYGLLRAMVDHGYQPIPQLAGLARTLTMLDEALQLLDPDLDPSHVVEERSQSMGVTRMLDSLDGSAIAARSMDLSQLATRGPRSTLQLLEHLANGTFTVQVEAFDEDKTINAIRKIANRIAGAVIVAALLISGAMLEHTGAAEFGGLSLHALALLALGGAGAVLLLAYLFLDR